MLVTPPPAGLRRVINAVGSVPGLGKLPMLSVQPVRFRKPMPVSMPLPAAVLPVILAQTEGVPVTVADKPALTVMPKRLQPPQFGALIELFEMVTLMMPELPEVASAWIPSPSCEVMVLPLIVPVSVGWSVDRLRKSTA